MWSRKQPPAEDPNQGDDPLQPFNASTVRRRVDNANAQTQALNPDELPGADAPDWTNRRQDRLNRRIGGGRVYGSNVKGLVQNVNNRQLFVIGGVLLTLVVVLLAFRTITKKSPTSAATGRTNTTATVRTTAGARASAGPSAGSIGIGNVPADTSLTIVPQAAGGKSFTVFNTENVGLKIRDQPAKSGNQIGTFPDGTRVQATGPEQQGDGLTWIKVKGPQGEGWVAKEFLKDAQ